jgi:hypothetical protein
MLAQSAWGVEALQEFYGIYRGDGKLQAKAETVTVELSIEPVRSNQVLVEWRLSGSSMTGDSESRRHSTTRTVFEPGPRPGMLSDIKVENPLDGGSLRWGRVDGDNLILYSMSVDGNGNFDLVRISFHMTGPDRLRLRAIRQRPDANQIELLADLDRQKGKKP